MVGDDVMRAARFEGAGKPLTVHEIPVPQPAADEVLVRVATTGLCGSDVHIAVEGITPTPYVPITLGHEIAGTVAAVGDAVTDWVTDERVCVFPLLVDGTCTTCLAGHSEICLNRRIVGVHVDGGLAEYVAVPARNLVPIPDGVPFEQASVCTDAVITPPCPGRRRPAGPWRFGCRHRGRWPGTPCRTDRQARRRVARDRRRHPPDPARTGEATGADLVVDAAGESVVDAVLAATATAGVGVDVAAEFIGAQATIAQAVECLRIGGRAVIVGLGADPITVLPSYRLRSQATAAAGLLRGTLTTLERVLRLVASGQLDLSHSVTHTFTLDEAEEALKTLHEKTGDPQRIVVTTG
jgi:D-arabinose 1-dehydrogenase-like Zn-dependent alcohol dehydrogenase